jgi:uncharacterized protein YfkK (UPF0435 family)
MNSKIKTMVVVLILSLLSCTKEKNTKIADNSNQRWEELEINTRIEKITISRFSDSADYISNPNNIAFKILREDEKFDIEKIVRKKIYFSKSEKDSLAKFIFKSVTKPKFTNTLATEFAGSVILKYDTGNTILICEYNSVGDWSSVSDITKKIYDLLSKKVEISKS